MLLRGIVGIRNDLSGSFGFPLVGPGWTLNQFPFKTEEVVEEVITPFGRRLRPGNLQSTGNGVSGLATAVCIFPAQSYFFERSCFGFRSQIGCICDAVGLAKSVTTRNERNRFFVVHSHTGKSLPNVFGSRQRVWLTVGPFGIYINKSHLNGGKGVVEVFFSLITLLVAKPFFFSPPVDVFLGFPNVFPSPGKTKGAEAHRFKGHIAGQNHQVGPGNFLSVFLFDGPQQTPGLIQVDVVGPAVEWSKALIARAATAASIAHAVGARAVPGHAYKQGTIMSKICRPPVLRLGHQLMQVFFKGCKIQAFEGRGIVEVFVHWIRETGMLAQHVDFKFIGPPVPVACSPRAQTVSAHGSRYRAFACFVRIVFHSYVLFLKAFESLRYEFFGINNSFGTPFVLNTWFLMLLILEHFV